jgi:hypothetical protein
MKTFERTIRNIVATAAIVLATACTQQRGAVYQTPIAEARQTLAATGLPPFVFGSEEPAWEVRDEGSDVIWTVTRDDAELFHYVAHLTEEGPSATRVEVELKGAESGPAGNNEKRLSEHPEIRDMYLVAIKERIASALEHRDFEISRVYPAMTAAAAANMGSLQASADEAAAASEKQDRENIQKAYRDEAESRR